MDANGAVEGLLLLWDDGVLEVSDCISNERCIIVSGLLIKIKKVVNFCNVYAVNQEVGRRELWQFILNTQSSLSGPWVIGGDFNTVLDQC